jgi:hypothetical protein
MIFNKYTQFDKLLTFLPCFVWVALQSLHVILFVLGSKMFCVLCVACVIQIYCATSA